MKDIQIDSDLDRDGYLLLRGVFAASETAKLAERLTAALQTTETAVLQARGQTYGSRDLARLFPEVYELPRRPQLREFLASHLGPHAGLVRGLFFDKPPDCSWSLPWHKDRTIAVQTNDLPSSQFAKPTLKAGIPHVEAPRTLLVSMLTLRIHLDPMTADNGPLSFIPGSHLADDDGAAAPVEIHSAAGDVLAMRPLLSHSSSLPRPGNTLHRRVIHLEFAPSAELHDGYAWYEFSPIAEP